MRLFAISDLHVDFELNRRWVQQLSLSEYQNDLLILAGDVSDSLSRLEWCLDLLARRFTRVLFVPGNHDLWVVRDQPGIDSLDKFRQVCTLAERRGVGTGPHREGALAIVPLLGWYDYSFGEPAERLRTEWMDFRACRWPPTYGPAEVTDFFLARNPVGIEGVGKVITFSHFLPRNDLILPHMAAGRRVLEPVFGCWRLDAQLRELGSTIHVYGHSHLNGRKTIDGVDYVNNAFGTPKERALSHQGLLQLC